MNLSKVPAGLLFAVMAALGAKMRQEWAARMASVPARRAGRRGRLNHRKDGAWRGRWIGSMRISKRRKEMRQ